MTAKIIEEPAFKDRVFIFRDRFEAGKLLADKLREYAGKRNVVVLGIPAGGVPVGAILGKELAVQMDVVIVRKIQIPWNTEAGFGAVTWNGTTVLNKNLVEQLNLTEEQIVDSILKPRRNIKERLKKFRGDKPLPQLKGKVVILVDDGLVSGFTMLAAARAIKKK